MPKLAANIPKLTALKRRHLAVLFAASVIGLVAWGMSTDFWHGSGQNKAYAITQDSWVKIEVNAPGLSSVTLTSQNYSFGDCNSTPGQDFTAPVTCGGIQFGPPNGVVLEMANTPSGYQAGQWSLVSNGTNGSVGCGTYACTFNFSSGTAVVSVVVSPIPPAAPSVSASNPTTASLQINWTSSGPSGSGPVSYTLFQNNAASATTTSTSYAVTGLSCGTTYSYYVKAVNQEGESATSSTIKASTSSCPVANPPPASPPASSNPPTSKSTSGGSSSGTGTQGLPTSNSAPASPAQPPVAPQAFQASTKPSSTDVALSWAAGDNANLPTYYEIDRSSDNGKTWITITNNIDGHSTGYDDQTAKYDTSFTYRLSALDLTGARSGYVTTTVTTSKFAANIMPDSAATISSDDSVFSVQFPAGAVGEPEYCSITHSNSPGSVGVPRGYQLISPLYAIQCVDSNNQSPPLRASVLVTGSVPGHYARVGYMGQSNGGFSGVNSLPSGSTVSFKLDASFTGFALVGLPHSAPWWPKLLVAVVIAVPLLFIGRRFIVRRRVNQVVESIDEQHKKEWGL